MQDPIKALLVFDRPEPLHELAVALHKQSVEVWTAGSSGEAAHFLLYGHRLPNVVFTDVEFPDGTWNDILRLAAWTLEPVNVVVVSPAPDVDLHHKAIERGALHCIVPPFVREELAQVIQASEPRISLVPPELRPTNLFQVGMDYSWVI